MHSQAGFNPGSLQDLHSDSELAYSLIRQLVYPSSPPKQHGFPVTVLDQSLRYQECTSINSMVNMKPWEIWDWRGTPAEAYNSVEENMHEEGSESRKHASKQEGVTFSNSIQHLESCNQPIAALPKSQLRLDEEQTNCILRGKNTKRTSTHSQHHIIAERKRREKLTQRFLALSAIVPGIKKTDKASVLGDAIKYVKQLQERQRILEGQIPSPEVRSIPGSPNDSRNEMGQGSSSRRLPEIQVRVLSTQVLIRIHCHKMKGVVIKVFTELEKLQLSVVSANVLTFAETMLDFSLTAEMERGWNLTVDEIIKTLRTSMDR